MGTFKNKFLAIPLCLGLFTTLTQKNLKAQTFYHNVVAGTGYNVDIIADGARYKTSTGNSGTSPRYRLSSASATFTVAESYYDNYVTTDPDVTKYYFGLTLFDSTYNIATNSSSTSTSYTNYKPLPYTNRIINSSWSDNHFFQLQNASGNNAIKINGTESQTFTLSTNRSFYDLYVLVIGANSPGTISVTFNYTTGTSNTTTFSPEDWYGGTTVNNTSRGVFSGYSAIVNGSYTQSEVGTIRTAASGSNVATAGTVKLYEFRLTPDGTRTLSSVIFKGTAGQVNMLALTGTPSYTISGTVYSDSTNDGIVNGTGSNTGAQYVVGTLNNVVQQVATIASNGAYTFTNVPALAGSAGYTLYLSTSSPAIGSTVTQSTLTAGWYDSPIPNSSGTGTSTAAVKTANVNSANLSSTTIDFGIHQAPTSANKTYNIASPTNTGTLKTMSSDVASGSTTNDLGQLTGTTNYPTSGTILNGNSSNRTVVITSLPTNGQLQYNGRAIATANYSISNYDKSKLNFYFSGSGYTTASFTYNFKDAAGFVSTSNATYTINLPYPLPVSYTKELAASILNKEIYLSWTTGVEINNKEFVIQRSNDGSTWTSIGIINSYYANGTGSGHNYNFTDASPLSGANYYRLNQIDLDGTNHYSTVININYNYANNSTVIIYPNPAIDQLNINNLPSNAKNIALYSLNGQLIMQKPVSSSTMSLSISTLPSAMYLIKIVDNNGNKIKSIEFLKK